jgi:ADP-ribose/FAD diphosphatase
MVVRAMAFCSRCGQATERRVPANEDRERDVCCACGVIHYQNPRMVVGCIVEHDGRVLMCRRAIEPRRGLWTLPAGFLELGESAIEGAVRETFEEARARVRVVAPYAHFDVPHIGQAYILYRAELSEPGFGPGPESLDVELFALDQVPWTEIAFPVVRLSLELLQEDLAARCYRTHQGRLIREPDAPAFVLRDHLALRVS